MAGGLSLFMAVLPILAISNFSSIKIKGKSLLMFWDHLLINWLLPIVALILSQWVYYKISHEKKEAFFKTEEGIHDQLLFKQWMFMIKWVVPFIILLCFILSLTGVFI